MIRPLQRRNNLFFRRLVAGRGARGELAPDVDVRAVGDLLNAVVSGLARLSADHRRRPPARRRRRRAAAVLRRHADRHAAGALSQLPAVVDRRRGQDRGGRRAGRRAGDRRRGRRLAAGVGSGGSATTSIRLRRRSSP